MPAGWRSFLPKGWATDPERCARAGVPSEVGFLEKWEIALDLVDGLLGDDVPRAPVIADSGYGDATAFRDALTERGPKYALGVKGDTSVWPPGLEPLRPKRKPGGGRPATRLKRDEQHRPVSIKQLAGGLPEDAWRAVSWREGSKGMLRSRFATVSVRPAHRGNERSEPRPIERLLIERPDGNREPTRYWLSTVPEQTEIGEVVSLAKLRWRTLRGYQERKDELGLDHHEGRNWRGFHHHAVLCSAAYAFLAAERGRLSPLRLQSDSAAFHYPTASPHAAPPVRPERHHPASTTSQRSLRANVLVQGLPRCPTCGSHHTEHP